MRTQRKSVPCLMPLEMTPRAVPSLGLELSNRISGKSLRSKLFCAYLLDYTLISLSSLRLVILGMLRAAWLSLFPLTFGLDYLMLNTDRGADNWMVKYCEGDHEGSHVDTAPGASANPRMPSMSELRSSNPASSSHATVTFANAVPPSQTSSMPSDYTHYPHIHVAAIDNSLSFPHEHPQGWRSYTYGWLYLPVSLIGRPFSERTRAHFLPLLTSKTWWEETTFQLRKLFAVDPDFHPKMFRVRLLPRVQNSVLNAFQRDNLRSSKVKHIILWSR